MLKVLIVEDDDLHAYALAALFRGEFRDVKVKMITSEKQFQEGFQEIESFQPDLVILDIMLRWTNARLGESIAPSDVKAGSFFRAGFRCLRSLSESPTLHDTPVIIHSILTKDEVKDEMKDVSINVFFLDKTHSTELFRFVRSVVRQLPQENPNKGSLLSKLFESSEIKPGWLGIRVDLKSIFRKKK